MHAERESSSATSGRKSPDPFKRFRRLSSSNSLRIATDDHPAPKPAFRGLHRAQSSSISNLSSVLGLRSKSTDASAAQDADPRPRKGSFLSTSASSSGSVSTPNSPGYQRSIPPSPTLSKQHRQAWYQAQQKTIDLEPRHDTRQLSHDSLFPMNVQAVSRSPSQSSQPAVETFMSEDEMVAAGIHIIRRQSDNDVSSPNKAQPAVQHLTDAQNPDLLEVIASPTASRETSPVIGQLEFPMARSLSHTGSVRSDSSIASTDQGFRSAHSNGSEQSLEQPRTSPSPAHLHPAPSASASPFLNRHPASVGRASGASTSTASYGLGQYNGAAIPVSPTTETNIKPPKPPKPHKSFLSAFPRPGHAQHEAVSPPASDASTGSAPSSRIMAGSNGYHPATQDNQFRGRLKSDSFASSDAAPPPPPRRPGHNQSRLSGSVSSQSTQQSTPMMRAASAGGVVGALGQVGQMGAAMGRRGWDFMKTFQGSHAPAMSRGPSSNAKTSSMGAGYQSNAMSPFSSAAGGNPATRQWLAFLDRPNTTEWDPIFGAPLKEAVLLSRLSNLAAPSNAPSDSSSTGHLSIPDLGKDFGLDFAESSRVTPRASMAGAGPEPYSRQEARHLFLPRIVVRCIESLERWGASEEGIYRISGRSSHTAKLRAFFADPREDLKLDDISPADLDINSVCSILKSYLRELPTAIIPTQLATQLDTAVSQLMAAEPDVGAQNGSAGEKGVRTAVAADQKAVRLDPSEVEAQIAPLVRQLPVYNWYLLRELSEHLGQLSLPTVVAQTKMPLSNLTLVLAPTVSISLPVLQVLVQQRLAVFKGPAPSEDVSGGGDAGLASRLAEQASLDPSPHNEADTPRKPEKPLKPKKPEKLVSASKLPVLARKRASSISLSGLLKGSDSKSNPSSPERSQAGVDEHKSQHSRTFSSSSAAMMARLPSTGARYMPPSPSFVQEPYERPSTSLGHFADASTRSTVSRPEFETRDAARRYNALALDDAPPRPANEVATPIARYYAQVRRDSPVELPGLAPSSGGETEEGVHQFWAEKVGGTSALDRPRPPTSASASFFAGRSRRQDSLNGLASAKAPPGSSGVKQPRSRESSNGDPAPVLPAIAPLKIVKRTLAPADEQTLRVQKSSDLSSSASSNTVSSAASTVDTAQSHHSLDDTK